MEQITISSGESFSYIKLPHDTNGNPRYYIPLTTLLKLFPSHEYAEETKRIINAKRYIFSLYRGKKYGYGYTLQSYSLASDIENEIERLTK